MNKPAVQPDIPAQGASPDANPDGTMPHGTPEGVTEDQPKARPSSDREATETAFTGKTPPGTT